MGKGRPRKNDELKKKCAELGISVPTYYGRIYRGWTPEEAQLTPKVGAAHVFEGKSVYSILSKQRYLSYLRYIQMGLTQEEAINKAKTVQKRCKYKRDGMSLFEYCKKHGLSYSSEVVKARKELC